MKKTTAFLVAIMLFIVAMSNVLAAANLQVTFLNQDPDPVQVNKNVDVRFKIENLGGDDAKNVDFELVPNFPFTLDSDVALRELGTLKAYTQDSDAVNVKYTLRTDKNAADGDNNLQVRYRINGGSWIVQDVIIDVDANTQDSYVSVFDVSTEPEVLAPGKEAKIIIRLENMDDSRVSDLTTKLDLSATDMPIAPLGSATEKRIGSLNAKDSVIQEYDVIVSADAAPAFYKIPLTIEFKDYDGNEYTKQDIISVVVGSEPELSYWVENEDLLNVNRKEELSVKFVNKGISDVKFLFLELSETDSFEIISPKEVYLGNIDSDDYETADFTILVKDTAIEEIEVPVVLSYKDANNNEYTKEDVIVAKLLTAEKSEELNGKSNTGTVVVIVVAVILVIGFLVIKSKGKKKRRK